MPSIEPLASIDLPEVASLLAQDMPFMSHQQHLHYLSNVVDAGLSFKAVVGSEIVGALLFGEAEYEGDEFGDAPGVELVLFYLDREYRGKTFSRELLATAFNTDHLAGFDFCWLQVLANLHTHNYWMRHGFKLVDDDEHCKVYARLLPLAI